MEIRERSHKSESLKHKMKELKYLMEEICEELEDDDEEDYHERNYMRKGNGMRYREEDDYYRERKRR